MVAAAAAAVQFVAEWAAATRRPPHSTAVASERLCMVAEQGVLCRVGKRQRATGFVPGTTLRALRALPQWAFEGWPKNGEAARSPPAPSRPRSPGCPRRTEHCARW